MRKEHSCPGVQRSDPLTNCCGHQGLLTSTIPLLFNDYLGASSDIFRLLHLSPCTTALLILPLKFLWPGSVRIRGLGWEGLGWRKVGNGDDASFQLASPSEPV
jgi:hypothetical protein